MLSIKFQQKSTFFQAVISYGQNLQNQIKFISIGRKMFKECGNVGKFIGKYIGKFYWSFKMVRMRNGN